MSDRVVVTGSTGFLGKALTNRLLNDGYDVAVIQRPTARKVDSRCTRVDWTGDVEELVRSMEEWKPETVFHLATHFVAQHRTEDLAPLIDANIALGIALLEAVLKTESLIVITGSAWQHAEGAPYDPVSLYAATKQALFDIAVYYAHMGVDVRELTFFDTYGPQDKRGKLVSLLLEAAAAGSTLEMSSGEQLIDLLYISDAVDALVATARSAAPDGTNPARLVARSGRPMTLKRLVDEVQRAIGISIPVSWGSRPDRPREMTQDWIFGTPVPGWTAEVSLTEGLRRTWMDRLDPSQGNVRD